MTRRHDPINIGIAAAETIARRMPVMWLSLWNPTAATQGEMMKMVVEKQMAFLDTCFALQMEAAKAMLTPWWTLTSETQQKAADAMLQAAMAPSGRRVKANLRRLRRR